MPYHAQRSDPLPPHVNEEITPLLLAGIGERYSQTISNLGHVALLRRCEFPNECAELSQGAL
jgi:hypothetical protein